MAEHNWKKWLLQGVGVGIGVGLVLLAALAISLWQDGKPRPWNSNAIVAGAPEVTIQLGEDIVFRVEYPLTNKTARDYILPINGLGSLMFKKSENGSLVKIDDASWNADLRIPPGQTVSVAFSYPIRLRDYNTSLAELNKDVQPGDGPADGVSKFLGKRMDEIAGYVFFDASTNYKIDLPRNWTLKNSKW